MKINNGLFKQALALLCLSWLGTASFGVMAQAFYSPDWTFPDGPHTNCEEQNSKQVDGETVRVFNCRISGGTITLSGSSKIKVTERVEVNISGPKVLGFGNGFELKGPGTELLDLNLNTTQQSFEVNSYVAARTLTATGKTQQYGVSEIHAVKFVKLNRYEPEADTKTDGSGELGYAVIKSPIIELTSGILKRRAYLIGKVNVAGAFTIARENFIKGDLNVKGALTVENDNFIEGDLNVKGSLTVQNENFIEGDLNVKGSLTVQNENFIKGDLNVKGALTVENDNFIEGDLNVKGSLTVQNDNCIFGNIIDVGASISLFDNNRIYASVSSNGVFKINQNTRIYGNVRSGGALQIRGHSLIFGNASSNGSLRYHPEFTPDYDPISGTIECSNTNFTRFGRTGCNSEPVMPTFEEDEFEIYTCSGKRYDPNPTGPTIYLDIDHPSQVVSCEAAPVTITAYTDSTRSTPYSSNVPVTLTTSAGSWNGQSATTSFDVKPNGTTLGLQHLPAGKVEITLEGADYGCSNDNCEIVFVTSGIKLTFDPSTTRAGESFDTIISAIETDPVTGFCMARAQGETHSIEFSLDAINPSSFSNNQVFNLTSNANSSSLNLVHESGSLPVQFNDKGVATLENSYYTDVGKVELSAKLQFPDSDAESDVIHPDLTYEGTANLVSRPFSLEVVVWDSVNNVPVPHDSNEPFKAAGEQFDLAVISRNANGDITPSFGLENTAQPVSIGLNQDNPMDFPDNAIVSPNDLTNTNNTTNSTSGAYIFKNVTFEEVGTPNLIANLSNYLGVSSGATTSTTSVGYFYPDHFAITGSDVADANTPLAPGTDSFTYMDQPGITLDYTVEARSKSGKLLKNYSADKYPSDRLVTIDTHLNGVPEAEQDRLTGLPADEWVNGKYVVVSAGDITFEKKVGSRGTQVADGPYKDVTVALNVTYPEGASAEEVSHGFKGTNELEGDLNLVFGRLALDDIAGPVGENLDIILRTEIWNGRDFVPNTDDYHTQVHPLNIKLPDNLGNLTVTPGGEGGATVAGHYPSGELYLIPNHSENLSFEFEYLIEGTEYTTHTNAPWFQFDWGTGSRNPRATATFGSFQGNNRIIFNLERL